MSARAKDQAAVDRLRELTASRPDAEIHCEGNAGYAAWTDEVTGLTCVVAIRGPDSRAQIGVFLPWEELGQGKVEYESEPAIQGAEVEDCEAAALDRAREILAEAVKVLEYLTPKRITALMGSGDRRLKASVFEALPYLPNKLEGEG